MCKYLAQSLIAVYALTFVFSANAFVVKKEDPLRPPEYKLKKISVDKDKKSATPNRWVVRQILFSGNRRIAIVNNVAVAKGDRVGGARVVGIKSEHVILDYKDKMITARMSAVPVKKRLKKK